MRLETDTGISKHWAPLLCSMCFAAGIFNPSQVGEKTSKIIAIFSVALKHPPIIPCGMSTCRVRGTIGALHSRLKHNRPFKYIFPETLITERIRWPIF